MGKVFEISINANYPHYHSFARYTHPPICRIIEREIRDYAIKKQKFVALLFPSLITGICEVSGVQFEESDGRIKNEGVITVRTVERIAGESAAITSVEC